MVQAPFLSPSGVMSLWSRDSGQPGMLWMGNSTERAKTRTLYGLRSATVRLGSSRERGACVSAAASFVFLHNPARDLRVCKRVAAGHGSSQAPKQGRGAHPSSGCVPDIVGKGERESAVDTRLLPCSVTKPGHFQTARLMLQPSALQTSRPCLPLLPSVTVLPTRDST